MDRKVKMGTGILKILGLVYLPLGLLFLVLGIALGISIEIPVFLPVFGILGTFFTILGAVFLTIEHNKQKQAQKLVDSGKFFWAEVVEVTRQYSVRINGRCPYVLVVKAVSPDGQLHLFRSHPINRLVLPDVLGRQVRVYAQEGNLKNYYVDVEPLLEKFIMH